MYYKGTTMDEIQKYLTEELQSAKEEKENRRQVKSAKNVKKHLLLLLLS